MNKFLKNILIFFSISIAIISLLIYVTFKVNYPQHIFNSMFKDNKTLILGDSHTECAINDTLFNSFNLSNSADAYIFSYIKLKYINKIVDIDTVILSYRPQNLIKVDDDRWLKDKRILTTKLSYLVPICELKELNYLFEINKNAVIQSYVKSALVLLKPSLKSVFNLVQISDYNIGGYRYLVRNKLKDDLRISEKSKSIKYYFSKYQNDYLKKILKYCNDNKITIILLETPTYSDNSEIRNFTINKFNEYKNSYNFIHINHSNFRLNESDYGDIGHLNYMGAKTYSEYLNIFLRNPKTHTNSFKINSKNPSSAKNYTN